MSEIEILKDGSLRNFKTLDEAVEFAILVKQRKVFICTQFDDELAKEVIRKVWFLSSIDKSPITVVINSGGGSVTAGLAIWDQLALCGVEIKTVVTGMAASMGAMLMLAASEGQRFATENSRIMVHQPSLSGAIEGQTDDLMIQATEILQNRSRLVALMHKRTGIAVKEIEKMIERDTWMSAEEARKLGFIDAVIAPKVISAI